GAGGNGTVRTGCGITSAREVSGSRCASGCAMGRVPQAPSTRASATPSAALVKRMQEYSVSICFMKRTAVPPFISFSRVERNEKPPQRRMGFAARTGAERGSAGGCAAGFFADTVDRPDERPELAQALGQGAQGRAGLVAVVEAAVEHP